MSKKRALIFIGITISIVLIISISSYFFTQYKQAQDKKNILAVATKYTESFGTYDSQKSVNAYISSFKPYLVPEIYNQIASGLNDPTADQSTRDYEKQTKYRILTKVDNATISTISKDFKSATVTVNDTININSTVDSSTRTETRTIYLVKVGDTWFVDHTSSSH